MASIDQTSTSVADLRCDYRLQALLESDVHANPIQQFQSWFDQAIKAELPEPNAMTLATVSPPGRPAARMVLLKGFDQQGFVFLYQLSESEGPRLNSNPLGRASFLVGRVRAAGAG